MSTRPVHPSVYHHQDWYMCSLYCASITLTGHRPVQTKRAALRTERHCHHTGGRRATITMGDSSSTVMNTVIHYAFPIIGGTLGFILSVSPLKALAVRKDCLFLSPPFSLLDFLIFLHHITWPNLSTSLTNTSPQCSITVLHQRVQETGQLGDLNPIPACVFLCNCVAWLMFSVVIKDPFVFCAVSLV